MAPTNERQATPATSFDPGGIKKKLLLRLFAAFKNLRIFLVRRAAKGGARSPEREWGGVSSDGAGGVRVELQPPCPPFA